MATSKSKQGGSDKAVTHVTQDPPPDTDKGANTPAEGESGILPTGHRENSGPGTGRDPEPDEQRRMPTSQPVYAESGPIHPPDVARQIEPKHGYADSSTNDTYAAAGGRTIAGEDHVRLEDEDGGEVGEGDLFDDNDPDSSLVTVKQTVVEVYTYPNAPDMEVRRLLLNKGQRVPRQQAKQLKSSLSRTQEPTFGGPDRQGGKSKTTGTRA